MNRDYPDVSEEYLLAFETDNFMCHLFGCDFNTPDNNACSHCDYGRDYQEGYVRSCKLNES